MMTSPRYVVAGLSQETQLVRWIQNSAWVKGPRPAPLGKPSRFMVIGHLILYADRISFSIKISVKNRNVRPLFKKTQAQVLWHEKNKRSFPKGNYLSVLTNWTMAAGPHVGLPGVSELGCAIPAAWSQVLGQTRQVWCWALKITCSQALACSITRATSVSSRMGVRVCGMNTASHEASSLPAVSSAPFPGHGVGRPTIYQEQSALRRKEYG